MKPFTILLITFFLATAIISLSSATRSQPKDRHDPTKDGGFFGPGHGFNIPGFSNGWGSGGGGDGGYGAGYGGPSGGGYSKGGIVRSTVECKEKGACYKKKLTCPAKCFYSYSRSGKNYGAGGGGGGCTIDCKKSCTAYC